MTKALSYKEFMEYSLQHYNKGGDGYYECWDKQEFDNYVKQFGEITKSKALRMYRTSDSITRDRMCSW